MPASTGGYVNTQAPPAGTRYWVTYPNGVELPFDQEWKAATALAVSGGSMRTQYPDGRVKYSDGRVVLPDGTVVEPDGTVIEPGGTVVEAPTG